HRLRESLPGGLLRHQRRALREREHEHEVEEQLERGDALLPPQRRGEPRSVGARGGHAHMISGAAQAVVAAACEASAASAPASRHRPTIAKMAMSSAGKPTISIRMLRSASAARTKPTFGTPATTRACSLPARVKRQGSRTLFASPLVR